MLNETNETNHKLTTLTKSITITLTGREGGGREREREGRRERERVRERGKEGRGGERENGVGGRKCVGEQVEERFIKMNF